MPTHGWLPRRRDSTGKLIGGKLVMGCRHHASEAEPQINRYVDHMSGLVRSGQVKLTPGSGVAEQVRRRITHQEGKR